MRKSRFARVQLHLEGLEDRTTPSASGLLGELPIVPTITATDVVGEVAQFAPLGETLAVVERMLTTEETELLQPVHVLVNSPILDAALTPVRSLADHLPVAPVLSLTDQVLDRTDVSAVLGGVMGLVEQTSVGPLMDGLLDVVHEVGQSAFGTAFDEIIPESGPLPFIPGLPPIPGVLPGPTMPTPEASVVSAPMDAEDVTFASTTVPIFVAGGAFDSRATVEDETLGADRESGEPSADVTIELTVGVVPPDVETQPMGERNETLLRDDAALSHERATFFPLPAAESDAPDMGWSSWIFGLGQFLLGALALAWFIYFDRRTPHPSSRMPRRS